MENKKEKAFVDGLVKDQSTTVALQKLYRKPIEVKTIRHSSLVESLHSELHALDEAMPQADEATKAEALKRQEVLKADLVKFEADVIEGVLYPLSYRDVNDIKAAITEAILHFQEYKFDMDVVMARVAAEERYMTIFCALRQKSNPDKRYFANLEEVAAVEEPTIQELYVAWEKNFVLTDTELKN
jgi:hypothetical protein